MKPLLHYLKISSKVIEFRKNISKFGRSTLYRLYGRQNHLVVSTCHSSYKVTNLLSAKVLKCQLYIN